MTNLPDNITSILCTLPALFIALPFHEMSHAFAADRLGDPTAKTMGRLTMNPFKHFDVLGTICLLLFQFGWAKPVPVNPRNFKNAKAGMAITALAGPLSNLFLGFIFTLLFAVYYAITNDDSSILATIILNIATINIGLCIFNLIPLPPLDGERILVFFLPPSAEMFFERYGMYFQIILLVLLFSPVLSKPLTVIVNGVFTIFGIFSELIISLI